MKTRILPFATYALVLLFINLGLLLLPAAVQAHAVLVESIPKDNSVLAPASREVILLFNARIEQQVSQLLLIDSRGNKLPLPRRRPGNAAVSHERLVVPLPPLKPGIYRLQYRILATDGHATPGQIRFTVAEGGGP